MIMPPPFLSSYWSESLLNCFRVSFFEDDMSPLLSKLSSYSMLQPCMYITLLNRGTAQRCYFQNTLLRQKKLCTSDIFRKKHTKITLRQLKSMIVMTHSLQLAQDSIITDKVTLCTPSSVKSNLIRSQQFFFLPNLLGVPNLEARCILQTNIRE